MTILAPRALRSAMMLLLSKALSAIQLPRDMRLQLDQRAVTALTAAAKILAA